MARQSAAYRLNALFNDQDLADIKAYLEEKGLDPSDVGGWLHDLAMEAIYG